jgi:hypothetical protein
MPEQLSPYALVGNLGRFVRFQVPNLQTRREVLIEARIVGGNPYGQCMVISIFVKPTDPANFTAAMANIGFAFVQIEYGNDGGLNSGVVIDLNQGVNLTIPGSAARAYVQLTAAGGAIDISIAGSIVIGTFPRVEDHNLTLFRGSLAPGVSQTIELQPLCNGVLVLSDNNSLDNYFIEFLSAGGITLSGYIQSGGTSPRKYVPPSMAVSVRVTNNNVVASYTNIVESVGI